MKIAFIPSTVLPHIGGAEIQAHNVANKLVERGHDVEIFVASFRHYFNTNRYNVTLVWPIYPSIKTYLNELYKSQINNIIRVAILAKA